MGNHGVGGHSNKSVNRDDGQTTPFTLLSHGRPKVVHWNKVLRLAPRRVQDSAGETVNKPPSSELISLENICKARQIELRRDAEPTWHCLCCGIEGY
jgi:hypothetical protein